MRNTYNDAGLLDEVELDRGTGSGYATVLDQTGIQRPRPAHVPHARQRRADQPRVRPGPGAAHEDLHEARRHVHDALPRPGLRLRPGGQPGAAHRPAAPQHLQGQPAPPEHPAVLVRRPLPPGARPRPQARHSHRQVHPRHRELARPERLRPRTTTATPTTRSATSPRTRSTRRGACSTRPRRIDLFNGDRGEATDDDPELGNFRYDDNGNTTKTPRIDELAYTHDNQARYVDLGGGGEVRYLRHGDQRVVRLVNKSPA